MSEMVDVWYEIQIVRWKLVEERVVERRDAMEGRGDVIKGRRYVMKFESGICNWPRID
jgi:hypothetical protein